MAPPTTVCRVWLKGGCKYGESCRFLHKLAPSSIEHSSSAPDRRRKYKKMARVRAMMRDTENILCAIELSELDHGFDDPVKLTEYQFLASYNWSKVKEPTIFVPGCPPLWSPPLLPVKLSKDSGNVYVDQNAHRTPTHSFDPFFKSLLTMNPNFDMGSVSLVSDRNSLRKLFGFACNHPNSNFRIDVDVVYNTMFFTRWEQNHMQIINGFFNSGYGHEFEKAFTKFHEDLANSSGHHRIVQYNLGGMKCLVRYEADAYFDDNASTSSLSLAKEYPMGQLNATDKDISTVFESLFLDSKGKGAISTPKKGVRVIQTGHLIAPSSIVEIKSRSKAIKMKEVIPQLWFSQTEHLFVGHHREGIIEQETTRYDMAAYFKAWETQHEEQLHKLLSLILRIKEAVQQTEGRRGVIIYDHAEKSRKIKVYGTDKKGLMVLLDVEKKCWNKQSS